MGKWMKMQKMKVEATEMGSTLVTEKDNEFPNLLRSCWKCLKPKMWASIG